MNIFIAIILTAELIIMFAIIGMIWHFDRKVIVLIQRIDENRPKLQEKLKNIRKQVEKYTLSIGKFCDFVRHQRENFIFPILQSLIIYFLMFCVSKKKRKVLATFRLVCALRDCL